MVPIYRWMMTLDGVREQVFPVYKDDLSLSYEQESQQRFFRAKLSGKINLIAEDADKVIQAPFETEFLLDIEISTDMGLTWSVYYQSHFYKTDCTINFDDRKVTLQPEVKDRYNDIMAGFDKEFNLIELNPAIQAVGLTKRPMFQLYNVGENIVSCYCGGEAFEQDMAETSEERIRECGFGSVDAGWEFNFVNPAVEGFAHPFSGFNSGDGSEFWSVDTTYYIVYYLEEESRWFRYGLRIIKRTTGEVCWSVDYESWFAPMDIPEDITFPANNGRPALRALKHEYGMYGRLVLDRNDVQGWQVFDLQTNDVVVNNRNYHYCLPYVGFDVRSSTRVQAEPTKWGRNDAGLYFLPPDDVHEWFPVGRSQWVNTSLWLQYTADMGAIEVQGRKEFLMKDSFPLWSVIKVLLGKVAPNISFEGTEVFSEFLYGSRKTLFDRKVRLFLAPKSNIVVGEYQEPAMKAPCTLGEVLKMLQKVYGCYWFIDEQNRLRIEHISYFKNGGSYDGEPAVGLNLTKTFNVRNNKDWAFATSEVKFDKGDMPERYEYEWMDESTEVFNGSAVNVLSKFVNEGKIEDVTISGFTADVDYMLLAPEMCSKDGFALLGAKSDGQGGYKVEIVNQGFGSTESVQNYWLSLTYLIPNYLISDMPSWRIEVKGQEMQALGIQRKRKQSLSFPMITTDVNLMQLITTYIGNGEFDKVEVNLSSRMAKVQLKFDTYDRE